MNILKYTTLCFFTFFLFTACAIKQQKEPTVSKEYATLIPSMDSKHYDSNLNASTIFIRYINDKRFNKFTQRQKREYVTSVGQLKVYLEEEYNSDFVFSAILEFEVKKNQEYQISSNHKTENNKIVNVEFYILNKSRIIKKVMAKRKKKFNSLPLTVPSSI